MKTVNQVSDMRSKTAKNGRGDKFCKLVEVLQEMIDREFTGHLKINFSQGGIGRIEKFEEILKGSPSRE